MTLRHPDPYDGPLTYGLDVSYAQPAVDWHRVASSGYAFAYCKAGENGHVDHTFFSHYLGARMAGLVPGAYWYLHTETPPTVQAAHFADVLSHVWKPGDLAPVADLERGAAHGHTADFLLGFLETVQKRIGVRPAIYSGHTVAEFANDPRLIIYDAWVPSYGHQVCQVPRPFKHWRLWQTTGRGQLPGIPNHVDLDVFRGDRAAFDEWRGAA